MLVLAGTKLLGTKSHLANLTRRRGTSRIVIGYHNQIIVRELSQAATHSRVKPPNGREDVSPLPPGSSKNNHS